jgi:hypothetical protein
MTPFARLARTARIGTLVTLALTIPMFAQAAVRKEGSWPNAERKVTFDFEGKPSDALRKLGDEAGWSLIVASGLHGATEKDVKIDVENQPADAVLDALFADADVVAKRNGTLISISQAPASPATAPPQAPPGGSVSHVDSPSSPAVPSPSTPPVPTVRGQDRNVFGSALTVAPGEVVHSLTVTGGSAEIYGTVTGDLVIAGGAAKIHDGGRVVGNATVVGGALVILRGGRVDGDAGILGGSLKREDGAIVGGKVESTGGSTGKVRVNFHDGNVEAGLDATPPESRRVRFARAAHSFGQSVTNVSLLFVFGCVALALATRKMEVLRTEAAARPMKSFAIGLVSSLAAGVLLLALCLSLVGIPFAALAAVGATFVVFASMSAALTTVGAALAGHRTQNPYVHLLIGCVLFLVLGALPYVGGFITAFVVLVAIGSLVSTRGAGAVSPRVQRPELV